MNENSGKKVIVHSKRRVFDDFFAVDEAVISYEAWSGEMIGPIRRLSFERGDSVAVLVLRKGPSPKIALVSQFRYPVHVHDDGWITETVAGMVSAGETPEDALRRELLEELGYATSVFEHVSTFYPSPGGSSERIFLYYCEVSEIDAVPGLGGGLKSENEDIRILEYDTNDFFQKLDNGFFVDPKVIISGLWLRSRLRPEGNQER